MAALPEIAQWELEIYQLELSDPVLGGLGGISNLQPTQLANRTAYLKAQLESFETTVQAVEASNAGFDGRITAAETAVTANEAAIAALQNTSADGATVTALQAQVDALDTRVSTAEGQFAAYVTRSGGTFDTVPIMGFDASANYEGNVGDADAQVATTGFVNRRISAGFLYDTDAPPAAADVENVFSHNRIEFTGGAGGAETIAVDTGAQPGLWHIINKSSVFVDLTRGSSTIPVSPDQDAIVYGDATELRRFTFSSSGIPAGATLESPNLVGEPKTSDWGMEGGFAVGSAIVNVRVMDRRTISDIEHTVADGATEIDLATLEFASYRTHVFKAADPASDPFQTVRVLMSSEDRFHTIINTTNTTLVFEDKLAGGRKPVAVVGWQETCEIYTSKAIDGGQALGVYRTHDSLNKFDRVFRNSRPFSSDQTWTAPDVPFVYVTLVGGGGSGATGADQGTGVDWVNGNDGNPTTVANAATGVTLTANGGGGGECANSTTQFSPAGLYGGGTSDDYFQLRGRPPSLPWPAHVRPPVAIGGPRHNGAVGGKQANLGTDTDARHRYGIGGDGGHGFVSLGNWAYDGAVNGERGYRCGKGGYGSGAGGGGSCGDIAQGFNVIARAGGGGGGAGQILYREQMEISAPGQDLTITIGTGGAGVNLNRADRQYVGGQGANGIVVIEW